jgi:hypothetical protein
VVSALQKEVFETDGRIYIHFVDALEKTLLQRNLGKHLEILKSAAPGGMRLTDILDFGFGISDLGWDHFEIRNSKSAILNPRPYIAVLVGVLLSSTGGGVSGRPFDRLRALL